MIDWIIGGIILAAVIGCIYYLYRKKKSGSGCSSCSAGCDCCGHAQQHAHKKQ